jgi:phosphoribosylformimino-5-aminoimidazole carboxamide ribotide isomerase
MRIIPVIDLKGGQVVRGIAGDRGRYRPVVSVLTAEPSPRSIAAAFANQLGMCEVYVADLDAIAGREPDWAAYEQIAGAGLRPLVDAGIGDDGRARQLAQWAAGPQSAGLVVGLESVRDPAQLPSIHAVVARHRSVFSLDLRNGVPWASSVRWQSWTAGQIAGHAVHAGFLRLLVLDIASVGMDQGPAAASLCRRLRDPFPEIELLTGGGIRGVEDLRRLAASGCDAALVASALHDGRLTAADLTGI